MDRYTKIKRVNTQFQLNSIDKANYVAFNSNFNYLLARK